MGGGETRSRSTHTPSSDSSVNWAVNGFDHVGKEGEGVHMSFRQHQAGLCLPSQRGLCLSPLSSPYHVHLHSLEPQGQVLTWRPFKAASNSHSVAFPPSNTTFRLPSSCRPLVQGAPEHTALHRDEKTSKLNFLQRAGFQTSSETQPSPLRSLLSKTITHLMPDSVSFYILFSVPQSHSNVKYLILKCVYSPKG
jgi:hypothetical protein